MAAKSTTPEPARKRTPTPAAAFRRVREEGELITLPDTDRTVLMRTVTAEHLLRLGDIPEILAELAIQILYGSLAQEKYAEFHELGERVEHALAYAQSLRVVNTAALIYPVIVEDRQADDEILFDDLTRGEKRWIFDLGLMEATGLSLFRQQQEKDVAMLGEGQGDAPEAEPDAGGSGQPGSLPV